MFSVNLNYVELTMIDLSVSPFMNKVAFITGAASGLGFITAREFALAGCSIALVDLNEDAVVAAAKSLSDEGFNIIGITCDVADEKQVESAVNKTVTAFGRLDFAFNNAGIHCPVTETADCKGEDFDRVIAVNLKGVWNCLKHQLLHMRKAGSGAIVNCSSQSGMVGTAGLGAYTASKHAVIGLTKSSALEYAEKGIRINAICPGTSDTPMVALAIANAPEHMAQVIDEIPMKRLGKPEEIAAAVLFLCSENAGFMVGQAVVVDGGYTVG